MLQKAIFVLQMKSKFYHISTKFGVFLSFLCAIHCMLMPVILMAFPFLHGSALENPMVEWGILATLVFLGVFSMDHYKKKHHGSNWPMLLFGFGATICFFSLILPHELHHTLMFIGSVIIAISQVMNLTMHRIFKGE